MFNNRKIRCVLVHDHVLLRQGLKRLLEDEPDIEIAGEAATPEETVQRVLEQHPDVVILDASAFEFEIDQITQIIRQTSPQTELVFLAAGDDEKSKLTQSENVEKCAERHTSAEELVEIVRRVEKAKDRRDPQRPRGEWLGISSLKRKRSLTSREKEVLKLLAEGRTVRAAADILGLSIKTVDAHKFNLMRKLGVHNKAELVMLAIQKRLVKLPANFQA